MRLSKSSLVAAAYALTSLSAFAQLQPITVLDATETVTEIGGGGTLSAVDNVLYNPAGGGTIAITSGQTLTIVSEFATTLEAGFLELGDTALADVRVLNGAVFKVDPDTGLVAGGNVVKNGGGILQVNSWTNLAGAQREGTFWWKDTDGTRGYDYPFTGFSHVVVPNGGPLTLQPTIDYAAAPDFVDGRNARRINGLQGTFTINQGTVRLAGFLNVWHDFGAADITDFRLLGPAPRAVTEIADNAALDVIFQDLTPAQQALTFESVKAQYRAVAPRMTGVSGIVLNGSSVLELTNSPLLVPTGASTNVTQGNALRVQYLRNLQAGLENDQFQTELIVGTTAEYRALVHIDQGVEGSIGILAGAGAVVKSGAGTFTILNESRITGDFTVSGGTVVLDSAQGRALATAASVNLASVMDPSDRNSSNLSAESELSRRGAHNRYLFQSIDTNGDSIEEPRFKPAYAPEAGTSTLALVSTTFGAGTPDEVTLDLWKETLSGATLRLGSDQLIRNFQSNFAFRAGGDTVAEAVRRAADITDRGELVVAGTGIGSSLLLGGNTLVIRQDAQRDGYYRGSVLGDFEFEATLANPAAGSYELAFDRLPGFGTFQLLVTDTGGTQRLTDSIQVGSAEELRSNLAFALGILASQVTVTDITAGSGNALAFRVEVAGGATVDDVDNLLSGRVVLDATADAAKLALILEQGTFAETEVRRGSLIVNAQGLGTSRINTSAGELRIYQNDTATLQASLLGGGTVRVIGKASIDNGSSELLEINSAGTLGTLNFATQQRNFTGELIVNDGIDVSFSSLSGSINDTFLNARAITLDSTGSVIGSTLRFNNTDQTVRNLAGDALSRIELGRGTMTLVATDANRRFLGTLTGVGSVIKRGTANFEFRGASSTDFYGATAVQQGAVSTGTADAIRKTSGLILTSGTTFNAAGRAQRVGALFGEAGSTINMGAAILTVGFDHARVTELRQQFNAATLLTLPLSHNYLGTTDAVEFLPLSTEDGDPVPVGALNFDRAPLRLDTAQFPAPIEDDFLDGTLGMADQTRLYLERVGYRFDRNSDGVISAAEEAAAAASAAGLDFAGRITGSGANQTFSWLVADSLDADTLPDIVNATVTVSLNKTGWETLRLTGDNTFTGALVIRQGTVEATAESLATASSIYVLANSSVIDLDGNGVVENLVLAEDGVTLGYDLDLDGVFTDLDRVVDGTLALFVGTGQTTTWNRAIRGDGNFAKTGDGTLVLGGNVSLYTGTTSVLAGTMDITLVENEAIPAGRATLGDVSVEEDATLILRTPGRDLSYVAPNGIFGAGNFTKAGLGTLTANAVFDADLDLALPRIDVTGTVTVLEGALAVDQLPAFGFFQELAIAGGAEFRLGITDDLEQTFAAELSGAGTFVRSGNGVLVLEQDTDPLPPVDGASFTGTLRLSGGLTVLTSAGSYPNAKVDLLNTGTTLEFDDTGDYAFAGLTGGAGTVLDLVDTDRRLTLTVVSGRTDSYLGQIIGGGDLDKAGAGILSLAPVAGSNDLGDVRVLAGTLRVTVDALGNPASIDVSSGAALEFNAAEGQDQDYDADITGLGSISKFGLGRIALTGDGLLPSGALRILEGTLAVDDRRVGLSIPAAAVSSGATLELILTGDRTLGAQVTGAGTFAVNGPHTLTLSQIPAYTGLTSLIGGADLAFAVASPAVTLTGLASGTGSVVNLAGLSSLTLNQGVAADFAGTFSGNANLVIQGTAAFRFTGNNGNLSGFAGNVSVNGGILQVGIANTKAITLAAGSTLQIFADTLQNSAYAGTLSLSGGTSTLIKVGAGTLNLTAGLSFISGAGTLTGLEVREGRAIVGVVGGQILGGAQLSVSNTGSIAVDVGASQVVTLTQTVSTAGGLTGGSFEKLGDGTLVLAAGATSSADILVTAGTLQLGTFSQGDVTIAGDIVVAAAGTLTGTAVTQGNLLVNGTVSPGYSPGTITVGGNLNFAGVSIFDAEVLGAQSDRIVFSGALTISPTARLLVTGDTSVGTRHVLLAGSFAGNPAFADSEIYTAPFGNADSVAYILAYPSDSLGQPNALVAIAVRPTQQGATSAATLATSAAVGGVSPAFIAQLSELARVEVATNGQVIDQTQGDLGRRLAALSEAEAPGAIKSLTGLAHLSGIGMAHLGASADHEALNRRLEQRRFDRGYMSVKNAEFFINATSTSWDAGTKSYSPGYDISRTGALAGQIFDFGPDLTAGWALSLDQSKATLTGGGRVDADQVRLLGFAGSVLANEATFVDVGASLGFSRITSARTGLGGGATADPEAFLASAWARVGHGMLVGRRTSVTPFAQLDVSHAAIGAFSEQGDVNTRLDVSDLKQTAVRARLGASLAHAWDSDRGDWRYRLSLDVAFVAALSGEDMNADATNDGLIGGLTGDVAASGDPLDRGGVLVTPAFTFGPDNDTSYGLSAEFRRLDGGDALSLNLSYRRRF
jgi:autotransporter-associated beta strand protein